MASHPVYHAPAVGFRGWLRRYWEGACSGPSQTYHNAMALLGDRMEPVPEGMLTLELYARLFGKVEDYAPEAWPTTCEDCGAPVPENLSEVNRQVFVRVLHQTREGLRDERHMPPGAAYWQKWKHDPEAATRGQCWDRDVCDPRGHLIVTLPDGVDWDVMSRANNCTMPEDRAHYCWVLTGDLEAGTLHVSKDGPTCAAGAGSIATSRYHGFLHNGHLVDC